jgi:hypothetical protein
MRDQENLTGMTALVHAATQCQTVRFQIEKV